MAKTNSYKKVIAGTMTAAMVAGVVSPVAAAGKSFPDVQPGSWSAEYIDYLVAKKAIEGKPDGTFAPTEAIDRASAAKIMAITLGLEVKDGAKPSFKDAQDSWAAKYIAAVEKAGVIQGDGTGNFNPSNQINRASMASMIVKAYKLEDKVSGELETKFSDLKDHWGEKDANILVALDITNGTGNGWEPDKSVTRAEAAKFIAKTDKEFGTEAVKVDSAKAVTTQKVEVKFSKAVEKLTKEDIKVTNKANNDKVLVKEVTLSEDKKSATVELADALAAKQTYTVEVNKAGKADVVVGSLEPKTIEIADQTVLPSNDITAALTYIVKDENGTDVTESVKGKVTIESPAKAADGKIKLAVGTSTTVKAVYKKDDKVVAESKEVKVSAQNEVVTEISNWTVAKDSVTFDEKFKQNNVVYDGEELKVQAQLKNQFGKEVKATEENVQFESLNTDVVVVDKTTGKVTVMGNGKAVVKISAKNGDKVVATKTVELDVRAAKAVKEIKVDQANLALSTKDTTGLTVKATVLDQYGNPVKDAAVTTKVKDNKEEVRVTPSAAKTNEKGLVELNVQAAKEVKGSYTVEVTTKDKEGKDLTATFTVDLKVPGVFAKYDVRGLESELDKHKDTEKETKNTMDVSVLAVDANGLALGAKETADKVEVKVLDKDGTPKAAAVTGTVVDATQLAKGDYTVVVSVDKKPVKTHTLKVVDSKAPVNVEFTSTTLKDVTTDKGMNEALATILSIDGTRATAAEVTAVTYVSSDETVVASAKESTGKALKAGTTTIFVQELTVKGEKVTFKTPVKVTVTVKAAQ
ncbi:MULTISPECIES: S-layer homology domain-containing protein [Bacillus]|uniref:S-layer homology domain-containing protein n=1 Tax=Bacillus cereus TaxID=1396 RepID=A0ABD4LJJ2_BACCE|nr:MULTISPECIES: S-layer homology domain-containing protein [Bacillus cereus group]AJG61064.1 S-layer protein sap [Bacillus cereus D17]MBK1610909.1 S-layer homology domain-containing protein [Bacillus cereus]MBR9693601.1 S-layer protein [Bacillus cereus]MCU5057072.1 S-layer homology domain-containing protein [Bacillus cereus]MEC0074418.1 S-layer homology domain-containing protein [Bacillus anthracis]